MRNTPHIPAPFVDGQWFVTARDGNPTKPGIYYIENSNRCNYYSYWNGIAWSMGCNSPLSAWWHRRDITSFSRIAWFGLSKRRLTVR